MVSLFTNDVALFKTWSSTYSTTDGLINAQGFYYSPVRGNATAVAWYVTCNGGALSGPISVLAFDTVLVNMQNVWKTAANKATIPVAGMYLIDLTIIPAGSGSGYDGNDGRLSDSKIKCC
jgi:hypothetical protein